MDLLQFADSIEGFAEVEEEIIIDESDGDLKAEIEALRNELRSLRREAKQAREKSKFPPLVKKLKAAISGRYKAII